MSSWYIAGDGKGFGPFSEEQISQLRGASLLNANDLVWQQGEATSSTVESIAPTSTKGQHSPIANQVTAAPPPMPQPEEDSVPASRESTPTPASQLPAKKRTTGLSPVYVWGGAFVGLGIIACVVGFAFFRDWIFPQPEGPVNTGAAPSLEAQNRTHKTDAPGISVATTAPSTTATPPNAPSAPLSLSELLLGKTWVTLTNKKSGLRLTVQGKSKEAARLVQGPYADSDTASCWRFEPVGNGLYRIVNQNSSLSASVGKASKAKGGHVIQFSYKPRERANHWRVIPSSEGYAAIINENSDMAMNVQGGATESGAEIIQWPSTEEIPASLWRIEAVKQ